MRGIIHTAALATSLLLLFGCPEGASIYDFDGDGSPDTEDCAPENSSTYPGAPDLLGDGIDQDCDGADGDSADLDGDGHLNANDCAPEDPEVYPGAADSYGDGVDQNCDGGDGIDTDGDGYPANDDLDDPDLYDCDDNDGAVNPGEQEIPGNNVDEDCDGYDELDSDGDGSPDSSDCDPQDPLLNHQDADGDTYSTCDGDCDDQNAALSPQDADGDGVSLCEDDCDDTDSARYPGNPEVCDRKDNDCDGEVSAGEADVDLDGYAICEGDCDDANTFLTPADGDGDGYSTCSLTPDCDDGDALLTPADADFDGFSSCTGDCDDGEPASYLGAAEACDGLDNDCDGVVPANEGDGDGDGYPLCADCNDADPLLFGVDDDTDGFSPCTGDCNEANPAIYPGAVDNPNDTVDQNCDGVDGSDLDGDGFAGDILATSPVWDCDDADGTIYPGATEVVGDGIDQDCTGADRVLCYLDADGDGAGGPSTVLDEDGDCTDDPGQTAINDDCDDSDPARFPGAAELCDSVDSDCDNSLVDGFDDTDGDGDPDCVDPDDDDDGYSDSLDCAPLDAAIYPLAPEVCDGQDNDCVGGADFDAAGEVDADADGSLSCADCDDGDGANTPGNTEQCDGQDNDCVGGADFDAAGEVDADADGSLSCADCDEAEPANYPGNAEVTDGVDNDCDGLVDSADLAFVALPSGTFDRGCTPGQSSCSSNESPVQTVTLTKPFWLAETDTTQGQWDALIGTNPSSFGPNGAGAACGSDCPVEQVNWYEAVAFANAMSAAEGLPVCYALAGCSGVLGDGCGPTAGCTNLTVAYECSTVTATSATGSVYDCAGYRLPTEAEWEYAARAGQDLLYAGSNVATDVAWYVTNSGLMTHAAATKLPNGWGLYDLSGNVTNWVWDWGSSSGGSYGSSPVSDPTGNSVGSYRAWRGGGWSAGAANVRVACRRASYPWARSTSMGFRVARTLP